jgi:hypothetical protein
MMPNDLPPHYVVTAGGRQEMPADAIFGSRTLQSTVGNGGLAGYDGAKRSKGNKLISLSTPFAPMGHRLITRYRVTGA